MVDGSYNYDADVDDDVDLSMRWYDDDVDYFLLFERAKICS